MIQDNIKSTISPALANKSKEELLAIIARKDAVELKLRNEILTLKNEFDSLKKSNSLVSCNNPILHVRLFTKLFSKITHFF